MPITSFSPTTVTAGTATQITISGSGFGAEYEFNIPVNIQHQASGVYFVELRTGSKSVSRKVVLSKQ